MNHDSSEYNSISVVIEGFVVMIASYLVVQILQGRYARWSPQKTSGGGNGFLNQPFPLSGHPDTGKELKVDSACYDCNPHP